MPFQTQQEASEHTELQGKIRGHTDGAGLSQELS